MDAALPCPFLRLTCDVREPPLGSESCSPDKKSRDSIHRVLLPHARRHFLPIARYRKVRPLQRRSQLHVITPQLHPSMSDLKTLFLIRHAESLENERIGCLQRSISNVGRMSLPRLSDLRRSVELINVPAQVDSDVSAVGWDQVRWRGNFIR